MNQILNSEPENNYNNYDKNYNNYNNYNDYDNNKNSNNKGNTDTIVKVFAICMIIFAIGLIITGVHSYKKNQETAKNVKVPDATYAKIEAEESEDKVIISVSHDKKINQVIYSWNGKKENKVQGDKKTLEKEISLPAGNNTLYIKVIDEDNIESTFEKNFESENGVDIINPEIDLEVVNSKLVIKASDETKLDFLTYRWNDEEETKIYPEENEKEIKVELDIMKSSNDITISVVDSNNNTTTETKTFVGVTNPEIVIVLSADGSSLDITCKHEVGIEKIEYTLNGQAYEGVFEDKPTEVQFEQALDVGYNRIILTATSAEKTSYTFDGETNYYPEGYDATTQPTPNTEENN
ncbi:MAG: hypothetical protein J6J60_00525 [Clostridia bacterium]|nr:hypothetical protein [Clostridia bacterium]